MPSKSKSRSKPTPEPEPVSVPKPEPEPVSVLFTSGEFHWLEIEVDGRQVSLDPRTSMTLAPGSHRVRLRVGEGDWRTAKPLELDEGQRYRVDFTQPASYHLTTR